MYESFYRLNANPFRLVPDARLFYASSGHKRGLAYLRYGLHQGQGFVVVTGKPGTGKSTLVQTLFTDLAGESLVVAGLTSTNLGADDILQAVGHCFDVYSDGKSKASLLIGIENFLKARARQGKRVVLIVDEAQNLPLKSLEELRMLSNFQIAEQPLLQILLLGQQELQEMLARPELEQLAQRVIASCHLKSLSADETRGYIAHRLHCAGWRGDPCISGDALALTYGVSHGIPRLINIFCDRLLLAASLDERHDIDQALAQAVLTELKEESTGSFALCSIPLSRELPAMAPLTQADASLDAANDAEADSEPRAERKAVGADAGAAVQRARTQGENDGAAFEPAFDGRDGTPDRDNMPEPPATAPSAAADEDSLAQPLPPELAGRALSQPSIAMEHVETPYPAADPREHRGGGGQKWIVLMFALVAVAAAAWFGIRHADDVWSRAAALIPSAAPPLSAPAQSQSQPEQSQPPATRQPVMHAGDPHESEFLAELDGYAIHGLTAPEADAGFDDADMTPVIGAPVAAGDGTDAFTERGADITAQITEAAMPDSQPPAAAAANEHAHAGTAPAPADKTGSASVVSAPAALETQSVEKHAEPKPAPQAETPPASAKSGAVPSKPMVVTQKAPVTAAVEQQPATQPPAPVAAATASIEPQHTAPAKTPEPEVVAKLPDTRVVDEPPPAFESPQAPGAMFSEFELTELLYNLIFYYESGNLERLVGLFAADAEADGARGVGSIRKDYLALFNSTEMRYMRIDDMWWKQRDKEAYGRGNFTVTVWRNNGDEGLSQQGELALEVVRQGDRLVIQNMVHQVQ
ncbi:hypothetical protein Tel_01015 [Candidatus Tenderia electrophaga]|jgi:putative secretion ATPase (PEP-CTERM system associated)|uniref:AAA+ ATPase domain-containing protein n=1 Tax=Candidatus Tenderia electrophaga TaxID=1748243 RepID=A0A0S2T9N2_9GAMM|nr:hypothetical protein Tel_01015 [Candidatus Tenderia electrophaga]